MALRSPTNVAAQLTSATRRLVVHLEGQEAALLAFRSLLQDLGRQSLVDMDQRRLKARLDASAELAERLVLDRELILSDLCRMLNIPLASLTLSQLITRLPVAAADELAAARRRLQRVIRQMQRQVATVQWILAEERQLNFLVYQLLGGGQDSDRYDASGRRTVQQAALRFGRTS